MRFIVYRYILNKANGCIYMLNISCPSQILLLILLVPSQQKGNLARMHSSYVLFLEGRKQNIVFNHSSFRYLYGRGGRKFIRSSGDGRHQGNKILQAEKEGQASVQTGPATYCVRCGTRAKRRSEYKRHHKVEAISN